MIARTLQSGDALVLESACRVVGINPGPGAVFLSNNASVAVVAELEGDPVGLAYGHELRHPDARSTMLLYSVDVAFPHRGNGHGRALVAEFVEEARRRSCAEVWVLTDPENMVARATYLSAGGVQDNDQAMFVWVIEAESARSETQWN
ncbi:MAG: GNAT family N-acetyltransferase [Acidimicrobiia bacterium]|nr:GNAT family N-acetyltransferase [Acidimicrobiia bacterium]